MISFDLCKKTLNVNGKNYTDIQVKGIRDFLYQMAHIEFLNYAKQKADEKSSHIFESFN